MNRRGFIQQAALIGAATVMGPWDSIIQDSFAGSRRLADPDWKALKRAVRGDVILPAASAYQQSVRGFNSRFAVRPSAIVQCRSATDVAAAIGWSRSQRVPLRARGGRHSYEGYSNGSGLVIDTRPMREIEVDATRSQVTVQAGAKLGEVAQKLAEHGLVLPAGRCASVGVAGLTLGGGYGLLSRAYGLTIDQLISVDLVDPRGNLLVASAEQNQELFWALRGAGGGNFGVATAFRFRARPLDEVAVFSVTWPRARALEALRAWQSFAPDAEDAITCDFTAGSQDDSVSSAGKFVGSLARDPGDRTLRRLLKPLLGVRDAELEVEWMSPIAAGRKFEEVDGLDEDLREAHSFKAKSDYVDGRLSDGQLRRLLDAVYAAPTLDGCGGWLQLEPYGGAIASVAPDATAFFHRRAPRMVVEYYGLWSDPAHAAAQTAWVGSMAAAIADAASGYHYVNYPDADIQDWKRAYWGDNYARLSRFKRAFDPQRVFDFEQAIMPAEGEG